MRLWFILYIIFIRIDILCSLLNKERYQAIIYLITSQTCYKILIRAIYGFSFKLMLYGFLLASSGRGSLLHLFSVQAAGPWNLLL